MGFHALLRGCKHGEFFCLCLSLACLQTTEVITACWYLPAILKPSCLQNGLADRNVSADTIFGSNLNIGLGNLRIEIWVDLDNDVDKLRSADRRLAKN